MNFQELEQAIKEYIYKHQRAIDDGEEESDYERVTECIVQGDYNKEELPMKMVYQTRAHDGVDMQWVFEHKNGEESVFVMFTGWYSSYEGNEVEDKLKEVKPYTFSETRYK